MYKNMWNMWKKWWGITIVVIFIVCGIWYYCQNENFDLKCIIASKDGNRYCVRENKHSKEAAELLAEATIRMQKLVDHVAEKYPERDCVKRLVKGFDPKKITETLPTSEYVAYSENKSKLAFCLTKKKNGNQLIDINTLMFVAIHELSHIANKTVGHKSDFWNIFKFLLIEADEINVYDPVDYKKKNTEFCSMKIKDNPYYDL